MQFLKFVFSINGRVRRREFWLSMLVLAALLGNWVTIMRDTAGRAGVYTGSATNAYVWKLLSHSDTHYAVLALLLLVGFTIGAKRYHDLGKSGAWMLLGLIPVIGWAWMLVDLSILPGTRGSNKYGPHPTYGASHSKTAFF